MQLPEKIIDNRKYQVVPPSVMQAQPLCTRAATLIGPAIASGAGTLTKQANSEGWLQFASVLSGIDPDKLNALFMDAVRISSLCVNGKPISADKDYEFHFSQFRADVFPVCAWVLWEVVQDFFPQLAAFIQMFQAAQVAGASPSPTDGQMTTGSGA
jgi:hypothetical protein